MFGSNGSVIPSFRQQIVKGEPLTVTSAEINGFYMLILEACRLVLTADTIGQGWQILVFAKEGLVKFIDLANRMIEQVGYRFGVDIMIFVVRIRHTYRGFEGL